ncbi:transposon Ty3-I Gag-Pol polyprotein [Trichonephila clavipes]|nr:transposon Ty3-I Gag-Pol polyprotein [Trichonephila clavipes]
MREDEKVSHLMKGVAEDIYQALLTREINDTASFIKWCNYIEDIEAEELVDRDLKGFQTSERLSLTTLETADGTTTLALKKKYADQTLLAVCAKSRTRGRSPILRRYRSPSPYRRSSQSPGLTNRETSYRTTPKFSGLFTKTDKSTAANGECETQDFTGDHAPINQRAYRVSPTERRIIHEEVQKMLDEGIVQPSESPWSSPIVLSLLKSGVEFHWGPEEVEAFNSLKKALTSDPVLGMYDERASTEIHTDAKKRVRYRSCLVQIQNNVEKVIAYASRTLTKAERIIPPQKGECIAIVWATNKFRPYIFGKHFTVVTDHHSCAGS